MNSFKTPSRGMAALITIVLLLLYSISYLAPALDVNWLRKDPKFDAGLQQTLLMLLVLSIGYYIGSSKGSAEANDAIRAQVANATPPIAPLALSTLAPAAPPPFAPPAGDPFAPPLVDAPPAAPVEVANTQPIPVTVVEAPAAPAAAAPVVPPAVKK